MRLVDPYEQINKQLSTSNVYREARNQVFQKHTARPLNLSVNQVDSQASMLDHFMQSKRQKNYETISVQTLSENINLQQKLLRAQQKQQLEEKVADLSTGQDDAAKLYTSFKNTYLKLNSVLNTTSDIAMTTIHEDVPSPFDLEACQGRQFKFKVQNDPCMVRVKA